MRLSIVILTYNQAKTTIELLQSLGQLMTIHEDIEAILVDNGSDDNTIPQIKALNFSWSNRLHIIVNNINRGVAAGRNIGIKASSGQSIMLLDNDTIVSMNAVMKLVSYIESNQNVGIAAPALRSANGITQDSAKPFPGIFLKLRHISGIRHLSGSESASLASRHPCYVIGACQIFRKSILQTVGMLDENIFYGPEDADFCMRVHDAGFSIDYLPEISIVHHWRKETRRNIFSTLALKHIKALIYFYIKHRRII